MDEANLNDIPFDISYIDTIVNYLIPINMLHSLLLIYLFHTKSHLSLKFFIVSNITLVITSYLFFGIPIDVFYIVPYLVFNFIYYNKRKKSSYIKSKKAGASQDEFQLLQVTRY